MVEFLSDGGTVKAQEYRNKNREIPFLFFIDVKKINNI